jgi:hypothetical protein
MILRKIFKVLAITALMITVTQSLFSQGTAGTGASYEDRYIVDMPTAGVQSKGTFGAYSQLFSNGGLLIELTVAPFVNFNIGLSYSGTNLLGTGEANFQKYPGVQIKWRIIDETLGYPAILIGLNTQGRGAFISSMNRYETISPGLYAAVSKDFKWLLGSISLHGGIDYSFDPPAQERMVNIYFGIEHSIGGPVAIVLEYNPTFDDTHHKGMKTQGMMNAALRWSFTKGHTLELIARDLLQHSSYSNGIQRWLGLEMITPF